MSSTKVGKYKGYTENELIDIIHEYHKYKDIEEELGIDLLTLIKAFTNGICYRDGNIVNHSYHLALTDSNKCFEFRVLEEYINNRLVTLKLSDYGKTWALTKEELEENK